SGPDGAIAAWNERSSPAPWRRHLTARVGWRSPRACANSPTSSGMLSWSVSTTTSRSGTPGPGERPSKSASGGSPKGTAPRRPRADEGGTRQSDDATHEQEGREGPPAHAQPPDRHGGRPLLRPLPSHRSGRHPDGSGSVGGLGVSERQRATQCESSGPLTKPPKAA